MSKFYQMVNTNANILNRDNWTQRFSNRGCDFLKELIENNINVKRFDIYLTRQAFGLVSHIKDRSPADCKFLQTTLKMNYGFETLPSNMIPMAQLEALVGAMLARRFDDGLCEKPIFKFNEIDVIKH